VWWQGVEGVEDLVGKEVKQMKQNKRQKKSDRILHGSQSKDAIMCDYALAPVDRLAIQMDEKWGIDVLPELVSVSMSQKYGSAVAKMNAAVEAGDVEECRKRCEVVIRGLQAMDAEAERTGAQRASTDVWEVEIDGKLFGVMKDGRSWRTIKKQRPELELLTLREVGLAYSWFRDNWAGELEKAAKQSFPGAEIVDIKGKLFDDPIPF
jgi:hypothetical protein